MTSPAAVSALTPRVDAAIAVYESWAGYAKQYGHIPEAMEQAPAEADPFEIARTLERELAEAKAERGRINDENAKQRVAITKRAEAAERQLAEAKQALHIAEEDLREERHQNGQFGAGV